METALAHWGQDGGGLYQAGPLALGSRLRFVTPEDYAEQQPGQPAGLVYVAEVRLDNRAELCRQLALQDTPQLSDSRVLVAAYQRWGLGCVQQLYGDWVFALWDAANQRLLLARDATGSTGFYWCQRQDALIFANGLAGVLAHPAVAATPDLRFVANLLTVFDDPEHETATAYQDVQTLLPGHYLVADAHGIQITPWWQPQQLAPLEWPCATDYYEAFRACYQEAVMQRLRVAGGTVAAMLSGGLDSGSIVALAAPALAQRGQRLRAYTHVPLYASSGAGPRRTGDEGPLAQQTAAWVGNVDVLPLNSAHIGVTAGMRWMLEVQRQPGHAAGNHYWIRDIWQTAQAEGVKVLLSGQNGNATVSHAGNGSLLPWLLRGQFAAVAAALQAEAGGLRPAIVRRLLKPLGLPLWQAQHRVRRPPTLALLSRHSTLKPELIEALGLLDRMRAARFDPYFAIPTARTLTRFRLGLHMNGQVHAAWQAGGAATGLSIRDPTADRRLVEFCWRLPDPVFWGRGQQRALVRVGMAPLLPAVVRDCRHKGLQSADISERVRQDAAAISAILAGLEASPWAQRCLNVPQLMAILAEVLATAAPTPALARRVQGSLLRGLGVGLWVTHLR